MKKRDKIIALLGCLLMAIEPKLLDWLIKPSISIGNGLLFLSIPFATLISYVILFKIETKS